MKKSSECRDGVAKFDTVCAADFMARNEAVRFDLKDPSRRNDRDGVGDLGGAASDDPKN